MTQKQDFWNLTKQPSTEGATLICWDIENVHIPDELQTPKGLRRLTDELRAFFCDETNRRLYCLKVGCCRPNNHNQNYINMLGWLTTFRDCEVVGYQWQRQRDKTHSADYVLQQAANRFVTLMAGRRVTARHLLVWITSDADFCQAVNQAKHNGFDVVVLYTNDRVSTRPDSIREMATASHGWQEFLERRLQQSRLTFTSHGLDPAGYDSMRPMPSPPDQLGDAVPSREFFSIGSRPWLQRSQPGAGSAAPPTQTIVALTGLLGGNRTVRLQCHLLLTQQLENFADQTPVAIMCSAAGGEAIALLYFGCSAEHSPEDLARHAVNVLGGMGGVVFDSMHIKATIYSGTEQSVHKLDWTVAQLPASTGGRAEQANRGGPRPYAASSQQQPAQQQRNINGSRW